MVEIVINTNISRFDRADREGVLTALVGRLLDSSPALSPELPIDRERQKPIRSIYFLLDRYSHNNFYNFTERTLPRILEQLHHTTERIDIEDRARVRGKVMWSATYKARYEGDGNSNLYICRQVRPLFDTPENQFLKYFIQEIEGCLRVIPAVIRSGFCLLSSAENRQVVPIADRLQFIETRIHTALQNIYLRQAASIGYLSPLHCQRAESSRLPEYAAVASLYRNYRQLIDRSDWHPFSRDSPCFLVLPDRVNPDTKIWIETAATLLQTYRSNLEN